MSVYGSVRYGSGRGMDMGVWEVTVWDVVVVVVSVVAWDAAEVVVFIWEKCGMWQW